MNNFTVDDADHIGEMDYSGGIIFLCLLILYGFGEFLKIKYGAKNEKDK